MMPIAFCASLLPCDSAMNDAETSCSLREVQSTVAVRQRLTIHSSASITMKLSVKPMSGESTSGTSTLPTSALHLNAPTPAWATTAPQSPPMSACDELDGMPHHQVSRFQTIAPMSAANTTSCVTSLVSAKPEAMVLATAVPKIAPMKLKMPAMNTAVRTGSTPV